MEAGLLKDYIDRAGYDIIYETVAKYVQDSFPRLKLAEKSNFVEEVESVAVQGMTIDRVGSIVISGGIFNFNVDVTMEIEIGETVRRDSIIDSANCLLRVHCTAQSDPLPKNIDVQRITVVD